MGTLSDLKGVEGWNGVHLDEDGLRQLLKRGQYHFFECGGCGQPFILPEVGNFIGDDGAWKLNDYFDTIQCPNCQSGFRRIGSPEIS